MTKELAGKTALVTGGGRGIGRGIARRLAGEGALVAINYASDANSALATITQIERDGGSAFAVQAKLGPMEAVESLVSALDAEFEKRTGGNKIDILVNNIGNGEFASLAATTPEQYDRCMSNNVRVPFFLTQALLPRLRDGGRVINISSAATRAAGPDFIAYAMAKAAVEMFTRVLAKDLIKRGILVNCVAPGWTATERWQELAAEEARKRAEDPARAKNFGDVDDIADFVYALVSPAGRWITGQMIEASGGVGP